MESTSSSVTIPASQSLAELWRERTELSYQRCVEDALVCLRQVWPKERIIEKVMKAGDDRVEKVTLDFEWRWDCSRKEVITQYLTEIGCDLTLLDATKTGFTLTPMSKDEYKMFEAMSNPLSLLKMMMSGDLSSMGAPTISATLMDGSGNVISSSGGCKDPNCAGCAMVKALMAGPTKNPSTEKKETTTNPSGGCDRPDCLPCTLRKTLSGEEKKETDVDTKEIDEFAKIPVPESSSSSSSSDSDSEDEH